MAGTHPMPPSRFAFRRVTLAVTLAIFASACADTSPVRVGVIMSSAGVAGAQFAASEVNDSGGIRGRRFELRVMSEGSATGAREAIVAADSLAEDATVIGVVAHGNSAASLSGSQIYNARRVVQIAPTSSAPLLSRAGPYTFRLVPSDVYQATFLADQIVAGGAIPRTAIFFVNDDYGRSLYQELRARLAERGVPVVLDAPYAENVPFRDVAGAAQRVVASHTELLVWIGRSQLRELLPAVRRLAPRIRVLASDGVDNAATESNSDGLLTGIRYVCFVDMDAPRPALTAMRDRFRAKTGTAATVETALAYDAVMLLATAARDAGARREAVHGYLRSLGAARPAFAGVTGEIAFDEHGDPKPSYCLAEVGVRGARVIHPGDGR